ncbi:Protein of unknown function, partial [Gryllus bimaculatus]
CLDREWRFHESTGAVGCNSPLGPHITSTLWNSIDIETANNIIPWTRLTTGEQLVYNTENQHDQSLDMKWIPLVQSDVFVTETYQAFSIRSFNLYSTKEQRNCKNVYFGLQ